MRVALDATPLVGARTGVGRFVAELAGALAARGDLDLRGWIVSGRAFATDRGSRGVPDMAGRPVERLPLAARVARPSWRHLHRPTLERFMGPLDAVHGTNFVVPPTRRAGRVVTVHDLSYVHDRDEVTGPVAAFDQMVAWAVRGGAAVHVPSSYVAGEVADRYPGADVTVVPEGAPRPALHRPAVPDGPPVILSIATAVRRKRLPLLVEAFGLLAGGGDAPDVELHLAGAPGPDSDAVDVARDRLPVDVRRRVHVLGRVDEPTRELLLASAAVVAVPSVYEGFGLPVLEAMAAGVPVVAAAAASLPEVAGDAARLVAPDDAAALADAIGTVLDDSSEAARLRDAGRRRAAGCTWDATADALVDLYRRVAGGG